MQAFIERGLTLLPLYTGDAGGTVFTSADTWPGSGGALGLTAGRHRRRQGQGRQANVCGRLRLSARPGRRDDRVPGQHAGGALQPRAHVPGPAVLRPALVSGSLERSGSARRQSAGADGRELPRRTWSQTRTWPALEHAGMYRTPSITSTTFGDVSLFWYMNQGSAPAAPSRGHLMDHIALERHATWTLG